MELQELTYSAEQQRERALMLARERASDALAALGAAVDGSGLSFHSEWIDAGDDLARCRVLAVGQARIEEFRAY